MKLLENEITGKWFYFFPFLFALYPIIFLYSYNVQELLISQLYFPVAIAFFLTILCWGTLSFLIKDSLKAGVIITIFIIFFYTYGTIFDWLVSLNLFAIKHRFVIPTILLITVYIGSFVYLIKNKFFLINVAKILTVIAAILLVLSIINVIPNEIKKMDYSHENAVFEEKQLIWNQSAVNQSGKYPDIYYIIIDEYASSSTIKNVWKYDNNEFENHLRANGFFIAENSSIRYYQTQWSLLTSLNMEYPGGPISHSDFHNLTINNQQKKYANLSTIEIYQRINDNKVSNFLRSKGYKLIVLDGWTSEAPSKGLMIADMSYTYHSNEKFYILDDFLILLIKDTMLRPLVTFDLISANTHIYDNKDMHRNTNLFILNKIKSLNLIPGPKYVFVHLTIPHSPFVFDENGNMVNKLNALNWNDKSYYLNQYIFTTKQISQCIDEILQYSNGQAIIIVQSDHGPRGGFSKSPENSLDVPLDDMFKIFNAYYLPGQNQSELSNSISPVNSFRVVFNRYFNENYSLLEDE